MFATKNSKNRNDESEAKAMERGQIQLDHLKRSRTLCSFTVNALCQLYQCLWQKEDEIIPFVVCFGLGV
jgi:hypothetical protein